MRSPRSFAFLFSLAIAGLPVNALAHPGHGVNDGFISALLHPFTGVDHLLAAIGLGLVASHWVTGVHRTARGAWAARAMAATVALAIVATHIHVDGNDLAALGGSFATACGLMLATLGLFALGAGGGVLARRFAGGAVALCAAQCTAAVLYWVALP
jgi:urease accessory protein